MGADQFQVIALGRTAHIAFSKAVNQAQYDFGHAGYTGTIAEKDGYVFAGPVSSRHVDRLEGYFGRVLYGIVDKHGPAQGRIPESMRDVITTHAETYDDKWGPAVCLEITGVRAKEIKERQGRKGTMDKVYIFLGTASS
jgi:hypothetical protein